MPVDGKIVDEAIPDETLEIGVGAVGGLAKGSGYMSATGNLDE